MSQVILPRKTMSKIVEEILAPKPEAQPRTPSCQAVSLTALHALHTMMALMSSLK